jgi:DUF1365 family protein
MPRLSEFYGIVIEMHHRDHSPPHFHATYGEYEALIGIDSIRVIEGNLPTRARRMVFEWAALHQEELAADWVRAVVKDVLLPIQPLR